MWSLIPHEVFHYYFLQLEQEILEKKGVFVSALQDWSTKWVPAILTPLRLHLYLKPEKHMKVNHVHVIFNNIEC